MHEFQKFVVSAVGAIGVAVSLGLLPDSVGQWLAVAVAFLTSYGVYRIPNTPQTGV
jgi:hypothetical protein